MNIRKNILAKSLKGLSKFGMGIVPTHERVYRISREGKKVYMEDRWKMSPRKYHREDGPAIIEWQRDWDDPEFEPSCKICSLGGTHPPGERCEYRHIHISVEMWYINGELHREDGPAIIRYDWTGNNVISREYYYKGKLYKSRQAWKNRIKREVEKNKNLLA